MWHKDKRSKEGALSPSCSARGDQVAEKMAPDGSPGDSEPALLDPEGLWAESEDEEDGEYVGEGGGGTVQAAARCIKRRRRHGRGRTGGAARGHISSSLLAPAAGHAAPHSTHPLPRDGHVGLQPHSGSASGCNEQWQ